MNYANVDFLLTALTFIVPPAVAFGAAMLGSHLVFTLPTWIRRRAHRHAILCTLLPELSLATVHPLRADNRDLAKSWAGAHGERENRRTA